MIGNPKDPKRNNEGYADPTAYRALAYTNEELLARKFLNQYYNLKKSIELLDADIKQIEDEMESTSTNMDGMPKSTEISDKTGRLAITLADYHLERIEKRNRLWEKRREIVRVIEELPRMDYVEILKLRYIENHKWESIAVEIDKSWKHTHRLHRYALQEVGKILKKLGNDIE